MRQENRFFPSYHINISYTYKSNGVGIGGLFVVFMWIVYVLILHGLGKWVWIDTEN